MVRKFLYLFMALFGLILLHYAKIIVSNYGHYALRRFVPIASMEIYSSHELTLKNLE